MLYRLAREQLPRHTRLLSGPLGRLVGSVPQGLRYGRAFREARRFLAESQWWSLERLREYQLRKLQEALGYAYSNVPYYRERFDAEGVSPEDLRSLEDIGAFPSLDREGLRKESARLLAPRLAGKKLMRFVTGGTTGSGTVLHFEESFRQREIAFIWRIWNTVGYRPSDPAAILQHQECPEDLNDGFWHWDPVSNAMVLSAERLSRTTIHRYLEALEVKRPRVLISYPSLAQLLATYAHEAGWDLDTFDLVLLGSETLFDFQRTQLESVLGAKVRAHYGHLESCALFGGCELSGLYHVQLEYGLTEFIKPDGSAARPGEVGEIVATGFDNRSMPFVRYRTGDWARVGKGTCECGRAYPLVERIEGRSGDFIMTPSGRIHSAIIVEFVVDRFRRLPDLQIVQEEIDEVVVKAVPEEGFSDEDFRRFCCALEKLLGNEVRVVGKRVGAIPRTPRQKKRLVISKLAAGGPA